MGIRQNGGSRKRVVAWFFMWLGKLTYNCRTRLTDDWRFRKSDAEMFFRLYRGHARETLEKIVGVCNHSSSDSFIDHKMT